MAMLRRTPRPPLSAGVLALPLLLAGCAKEPAPASTAAAPREAAAPAVAAVTRADPLPPSFNGPAFYGDAPDETHPWSIHDRNRPQPARVEPGTPSTAQAPGKPPSDAIVLFDGTPASLAKWEADTKEGEPSQPSKWIIRDGALECVPKSGYIRTKELLGDCQLHIEWAAPAQVHGDSQGRGNSGIFLGTSPGAGPSGIEVQVLDIFNNPSYPDGMAGAVYGINPPMANAVHPPGQFQTVDIVYRRPIFRDGRQVDPGRVTVFMNGVVVQDATPIDNKGGHLRRQPAEPLPAKGPLKLQDHGNPVRFRNIWYRPLPPRPIEGGTDGPLTAEATRAKRAQIAAGIRAHAATLASDPTAHLLRLAESLIYEAPAATVKEVEQLGNRYVESLQALSANAPEDKKNEVFGVMRSFAYLAKWKSVPADFGPLKALNGFIKKQGWEDPQKKKK